MKALEKNQQWLLYDQQREANVRGLLGRIFELEQRSEIVSQQQPKESNTEGIDFFFPMSDPNHNCLQNTFSINNSSNHDFLRSILLS